MPLTINNNHYGYDVAGPVLRELRKKFYRCSDKRNKKTNKKSLSRLKKLQ
jgi:hypothetical protein